MRDERAEPRLALAAMEIFGEHRALQSKRHLRGNRLERVDELAGAAFSGADDEEAANGVAEGRWKKHHGPGLREAKLASYFLRQAAEQELPRARHRVPEPWPHR